MTFLKPSQGDFSNPLMSSFASLVIDSISLSVSSLEIKESLWELFDIECDCYYEGLENKIHRPNTDCNQILEEDQEKFYTLLDKNASLTIKGNEHSKKLPLLCKDSQNSSYSSKLFEGIVASFSFLGSSQDEKSKAFKRKYFYKIRITSPLFRLSFNQNYRIFSRQNVVFVLKSILSLNQAHLNKEIDFSHLLCDYPPKEYITQYNESDLDFLKRICFNEGIYFYEDGQTLYFYDQVSLGAQDVQTSMTHKPPQGKEKSGEFDLSDNTSTFACHSYPFNPNPNNPDQEACIFSFSQNSAIAPDLFYLSSYSRTASPISIPSGKSWGKEASSLKAPYVKHFYKSDLSDNSSLLKREASLLISQERSLSQTFSIQSNIPDIKLNDFLEITLEGVSRKDKSLDFIAGIYQVIQISHSLTDRAKDSSSVYAENLNPPLSLYQNTLTLIRQGKTFAPPPIPKPKIYGSHIALVLGKTQNISEELNTVVADEMGRVRVRFSFLKFQEEIDDLHHNPSRQNQAEANPSSSQANSSTLKDKDSKEYKDSLSQSHPFSYTFSCYLKVASPFASTNQGFLSLPRVGSEVLVSYLDGDIDQPIITGSVYSPFNKGLSHPQEAHKTSLVSKTIGRDQDGYNEISFSNLPSEEKIFLKAQRDYHEEIQNNFFQNILGDKTSNILGIHTESILGNRYQILASDGFTQISGNAFCRINGNQERFIGGSVSNTIEANNTSFVHQDNAVFIGGNEQKEVKGNKESDVGGEYQRSVGKNEMVNIGGDYVLDALQKCELTSQSQINLLANDNILLRTYQSLGLESKGEHSVKANSLNMSIDNVIHLAAGDQINLSVGFTQIQADSDKIILKAGGVEVVIDAKGLRIKGGILDAE
ncbi:hypothetical protein BKH41_08650 [Helicobacter sp. 12S02232-10]|uniref:type VI secretion system Vgr family protein n=1 Tax=Helicobacter sp. 12S02232-10 TaxID=1476197 RepID=UPI000BA5DCD1|nr:contractile injection system protein, VgrG/Pvc8 family [Helicobacter sp. 12S02232-10]PAF46716.1 hypothetical protein BKH41_08650 [Helicobacter sp. 12S02232-10]